MDHHQFLSSLPAEDRAALTQRSDAKGLARLAGHIAMIAVLMMAVWFGGVLWWVALVPLGIALSFLFMLEHEATHQTPFKTVWLNEAVGHLAGVVLLLPFRWFRLFHMAHHRYTNDPERDPELATPKPETALDYLIHVSGYRYWRAVTRVLWRNAAGRIDSTFLPERSHARLRREARIYLTLYGVALATLMFSSAVLWLWIVPMFLGQPFLRLYLLAEHGRCPPVANMFANTRTTLTNRMVRFLAWNMPYHAEHHAFPAVPFHKLPELHRRTAEHLEQVSPGYRVFNRGYIRALRRGPAEAAKNR